MNKKSTKSKTTVKTMNFPLPQEAFDQLITEKIMESKEEILEPESEDESNVIYIDFKLKKQII